MHMYYLQTYFKIGQNEKQENEEGLGLPVRQKENMH